MLSPQILLIVLAMVSTGFDPLLADCTYVLAVPRLVRRDLIGQAYLPKGGSHGSSEAVS